MTDDLIENPILNSPFGPPSRHWKFTENGISSETVEGRRRSSYFMPIARSKKSDQLQFETEWTADRIEENVFINQVRERVDRWRQGGYQGVTSTTQRLIAHWNRQDRSRPLFFCQKEAAETAIYLCEVVSPKGHQDSWILEELRRQAEDANPGLLRLAFKMATGTGKTVVMAMFIVWQTLNRLANPRDRRFTDAFLVVTPGITIRDRLRVLLPSSADNYYRELDLVSLDDERRLGAAQIVITNFHGLMLRDREPKISRTTKQLLAPDGTDPFQESPDEMVKRVCRSLGNRRGIVVLNDEAHHCYQHRIGGDAEAFAPKSGLSRDERKDLEARESEARVWASGLQAVAKKIGVKFVLDLSATPFFLAGSGYPEGTLFPWVVSDFALIDAIEAGLVKVPRVPVADDALEPEGPVYRNLWSHIRRELPNRRLADRERNENPQLPARLEGALTSLYENYVTAHDQWEASGGSGTPPVFIIVCSNTGVSRLLFDFVAGWVKTTEDGTEVPQPGVLPLFSNVGPDGPLERPNTILVDSAQLESGEAMSTEFRRSAAAEIERFKAEYRERFPGRSGDDLTEEDLMREVMNTVGKRGRLGEHVRCVVSVSMLTEGWDANTVTHILGVRAFSTQLLCEQVVGRGLRRRHYVLDDETGTFPPEYAEVYGVPFSFIPASGSASKFIQPKPVTRVRALQDRQDLEIRYPRLRGYKMEIGNESLDAAFTRDSRLVLSAEDVPTETSLEPIVGERERHSLSDLSSRRDQEVVYRIAKRAMDRFFADEPWRFPEVLRITRTWYESQVATKDHAFPQMLLFAEFAERAVEKIGRAIVRGKAEDGLVLPMLATDPIGSSATVDFDTTRPVYRTEKSHVSHVVADTTSWEQKMAQVLEGIDEVESYVKNAGMDFSIPYAFEGRHLDYFPDFLVRLRNGSSSLNLVLEVSGEDLEQKAAKVETARSLWVPAVNFSGEFGTWAFVEIRDPWDCEAQIRNAASDAAAVV